MILPSLRNPSDCSPVRGLEALDSLSDFFLPRLFSMRVSSPVQKPSWEHVAGYADLCGVVLPRVWLGG